MAIRLQKFNNEIHTHCMPVGVGRRERFEVSCWQLSLNLGSKAEVTRRRVLTNIPRHLWPPVVPAHQFQCFPPPGMSSYQAVMIERHNLSTDIGSWQDVNFPSEVKDSVNLCPFGRADQFCRSAFQGFSRFANHVL